MTATVTRPVDETGVSQKLARDRAAVLADALPWLQRFAGALVVVKYTAATPWSMTN